MTKGAQGWLIGAAAGALVWALVWIALVAGFCGCRTQPEPSSLRPWQGAVTNAQGEIVRPTW